MSNERYYVSTYRRAAADGGTRYQVMDAECNPEPLVEEFRSEAKAKSECARLNARDVSTYSSDTRQCIVSDDLGESNDY